MKKLNIGLIGYGFMGRTHSNAFRSVANFFDLPYQPVLKTVCARNAERGKAFAAKWGYRKRPRRTGARWSSSPDIDLVDIASPNDTHAEIAVAAAKAGKMVMCEKPLGRNAAEARGDGGGRRSGRRAQHGLVQLPARPRGHAGEAVDRRGPAGPHLPLPRQIPAGLDDLRPTCRRAAKGCGGWMSAWPAAASPATCWRTASIPRCG